MRRTAPLRWIEEAEARQVRLYDAEAKPAAAESLSGPGFPLTTKLTLTVLVGRMTGRLARAARGRPSAGAEDASAEGCDAADSIRAEIPYVGPYLVAGTSSAAKAVPARASSYSRETSRPAA
jgi:Ser/Thr protein kinase RdoA (MazF antagonist)